MTGIDAEDTTNYAVIQTMEKFMDNVRGHPSEALRSFGRNG
jgi:hypothetical protein